MEKSNRRHSLRQDENMPVLLLFRPSSLMIEKKESDFIPATICNSCDEGFYVEVDRALKLGQHVDIKMLTPEGAAKKVYFMNNGRIIWCKKMQGNHDALVWA